MGLIPFCYKYFENSIGSEDPNEINDDPLG